MTRSVNPLELHDLQGNVVRGYKLSYVAHLFGTVSKDSVDRWKRALLDLDVTREDCSRRPAVTRNVGISHAGMKLLVGDIADELNVFEAYVSGMHRRADLLGDLPDLDWAEWDSRHVWIAVHAPDPVSLGAEVTRLESAFKGLLTTSALWGQALTDADGQRIEPFGFRDDLSQPAIEGSPNVEKLLRGGGKLDGARKEWLPIAAGEFFLGYGNERGRDVHAKLPTIGPMVKNGTFAVFRELVQDVDLFNRELEAAAAAWRVGVDELKAQLVGRRADGDSLVKRGAASDFTYDDDPHGSRCPFGAHVRRANPRLTGEHRVIRRGMPYRRKASEAGAPSADVQGIYLVVLNASIEEQFEFVQSNWLNKPAGVLPGSRDPVVGGGLGKGRMLIEGDAAAQRDPIILNLPNFVSCRGGQYYFVPGLAGLRRIAAP